MRADDHGFHHLESIPEKRLTIQAAAALVQPGNSDIAFLLAADRIKSQRVKRQSKNQSKVKDVSWNYRLSKNP